MAPRRVRSRSPRGDVNPHVPKPKHLWEYTQAKASVGYFDADGDRLEFAIEDGKLIQYVDGQKHVGESDTSGVVTRLCIEKQHDGKYDVRDQEGYGKDDFPSHVVKQLRSMAKQLGVTLDEHEAAAEKAAAEKAAAEKAAAAFHALPFTISTFTREFLVFAWPHWDTRDLKTCLRSQHNCNVDNVMFTLSDGQPLDIRMRMDSLPADRKIVMVKVSRCVDGCGGSGSIMCTDCSGKGSNEYMPHQDGPGENEFWGVHSTTIKCGSCEGKGKVSCKMCDGRGFV